VLAKGGGRVPEIIGGERGTVIEETLYLLVVAILRMKIKRLK
jgi:hypothetical protein